VSKGEVIYVSDGIQACEINNQGHYHVSLFSVTLVIIICCSLVLAATLTDHSLYFILVTLHLLGLHYHCYICANIVPFGARMENL
jgi:hypothetical protein